MSTISPLILYAYRHNALVAENYASFIILLLLDALGDFKKEFLEHLVHCTANYYQCCHICIIV